VVEGRDFVQHEIEHLRGRSLGCLDNVRRITERVLVNLELVSVHDLDPAVAEANDVEIKVDHCHPIPLPNGRRPNVDVHVELWMADPPCGGPPAPSDEQDQRVLLCDEQRLIASVDRASRRSPNPRAMLILTQKVSGGTVVRMSAPLLRHPLHVASFAQRFTQRGRRSQSCRPVPYRPLRDRIQLASPDQLHLIGEVRVGVTVKSGE
jgi:hypothetical protein